MAKRVSKCYTKTLCRLPVHYRHRTCFLFFSCSFRTFLKKKPQKKSTGDTGITQAVHTAVQLLCAACSTNAPSPHSPTLTRTGLSSHLRSVTRLTQDARRSTSAPRYFCPAPRRAALAAYHQPELYKNGGLSVAPRPLESHICCRYVVPHTFATTYAVGEVCHTRLRTMASCLRNTHTLPWLPT